VALRTPGLSGALLPAVKDLNSLEQALGLGYRQILLERGSLLAMVGALAAAARRGIAIFVNLDQVEGLAPDSAAAAFLATDLLISGVVSVRPHLLRDASRFRLRTVQRIHALDSVGLETGLSSIVRPAPHAIAVAPALAVPQVIDAIREVTDLGDRLRPHRGASSAGAGRRCRGGELRAAGGLAGIPALISIRR